MGTTSAPAGAATRAVCRRFSPAADQTATLTDGALNEVSGVAASRLHPPLLWVHNDSGGEPAVYAIRPDGTLVSTVTIEGATNTDWEDIAVGPGPAARRELPLPRRHRRQPLRSRSHHGVPDPRAEHHDRRRSPSPAPRPSRCGTPTTRSTRSRCSSTPGAATSSSSTRSTRVPSARVFRAPKRALVDGADVTMDEVATFTLERDEIAPPDRSRKVPRHAHHRCRRVARRQHRARAHLPPRPRLHPPAGSSARDGVRPPPVRRPADRRSARARPSVSPQTARATSPSARVPGASVHRFAIRPPLSR